MFPGDTKPKHIRSRWKIQRAFWRKGVFKPNLTEKAYSQSIYSEVIMPCFWVHNTCNPDNNPWSGIFQCWCLEHRKSSKHVFVSQCSCRHAVVNNTNAIFKLLFQCLFYKSLCMSLAQSLNGNPLMDLWQRVEEITECSLHGILAE